MSLSTTKSPRRPATSRRRSGTGGSQTSRLPRSAAGSFAGLALALLASLLSGGAAHAGTQVRVTTSFGPFTIELEDERAPLTVANFLRYVRDGHYDGTVFHRVVPGFVIQGGGLTPDLAARKVREGVPNESGNGLVNVRGTVGLARTGAPHSGDAQFYVNLADNTDLNPLPSRWGYAVFGKVLEGMDVVDRIGVVATGPLGPLKADVPQRTVLIEKVEVVGETRAAATSAAPAAGGAAASAASPSGSASPAGSAPAAAPVTR